MIYRRSKARVSWLDLKRNKTFSQATLPDQFTTHEKKSFLKEENEKAKREMQSECMKHTQYDKQLHMSTNQSKVKYDGMAGYFSS